MAIRMLTRCNFSQLHPRNRIEMDEHTTLGIQRSLGEREEYPLASDLHAGSGSRRDVAGDLKQSYEYCTLPVWQSPASPCRFRRWGSEIVRSSSAARAHPRMRLRLARCDVMRVALQPSHGLRSSAPFHFLAGRIAHTPPSPAGVLAHSDLMFVCRSCCVGKCSRVNSRVKCDSFAFASRNDQPDDRTTRMKGQQAQRRDEELTLQR